MKPADRVRLPRPERTGPIRGGTLGIFGSPQLPPLGQDDPDRPPSPSDAVLRTVAHAYSVVDDQIKQGEDAARRIAKREYGAKAFAHDVQDAAARSTQFLAQVFEVWLQTGTALASLPPVGPFGAPSGSPAPVGPTGRAAAPSRIVVSVRSEQPTEVTLDLAAGARAVSVQRLLGPGAPIEGVTVEGTEPPRVSISVPRGQAPGVYSGLVVDAADNRPVGSLTVEVGAGSGGRA